MPSRSSKPRLPDPNTMAFGIIQIISGEASPPDGKQVPEALTEQRQQAGSKGGKSRTTRLTKQQRSDAAKAAAQKRWRKSE